MKSFKASVVELSDLPPPEPNTQDVVLLRVDHATFVTYEVNPYSGHPMQGHVLIRLLACTTFQGGGPNDDALDNHPAAHFGLRPYAVQEVVNSPWITERLRIQNKDGVASPEMVQSCRHIVFAFKEGLLECIIRGYEVVGVFTTRKEALLRAVELSPPLPDDPG